MMIMVIIIIIIIINQLSVQVRKEIRRVLGEDRSTGTVKDIPVGKGQNQAGIVPTAVHIGINSSG
jgi:hypothetical protein